jgi:hypothetical protein
MFGLGTVMATQTPKERTPETLKASELNNVQTQTGLWCYLQSYLGLNHPDMRKSRACRGPGTRLGDSVSPSFGKLRTGSSGVGINFNASRSRFPYFGKFHR